MSAAQTQPRFRDQRLPDVPPWLLIAAALLSAALVGRMVAGGHITYGYAIVLAACYAPLVFFNVPAALAVWVAVLFFQDLRVLSVAPNSMGEAACRAVRAEAGFFLSSSNCA